MPINIRKAKAKCLDCGVEFVASLTIEVWDYGHLNDLGVASGNLQQICARHHDVSREWGVSDAPQHSAFIVFQGSREIGEMTVSSMGREHRFIIIDKKVREVFHAEIQEMQERHLGQF